MPFKKGKDNYAYIHGKYSYKKRYCKKCGKLLKCRRLKTKYCYGCGNKIMVKTRTIWHRHHLYLKKFKTDKVIIMRNTKHQSFHSKVYEYLLETQGKIAIRKYLKWFIKKYNGVS
jgi:methionyl-tRNA synthetase